MPECKLNFRMCPATAERSPNSIESRCSNVTVIAFIVYRINYQLPPPSKRDDNIVQSSLISHLQHIRIISAKSSEGFSPVSLHLILFPLSKTAIDYMVDSGTCS